MAKISHKNLKNLIKAAFVEKQIYIPNESLQSTPNRKIRIRRKQKVTPYILFIFAVFSAFLLLQLNHREKKKKKVFGLENSIVVWVVKEHKI